MTQQEAGPTVEAPVAEPPTALARIYGPGRLIGVDFARGLAVFGMYAAHAGSPSAGGVAGFVRDLTQGRALAMSAVLVGLWVVLVTGRRTLKTGVAGRQAVAKVLIRASVLLMVGALLTVISPPGAVMLVFCGSSLVLVLPLHRLNAIPLAAIAAGAALVLPQVSLVRALWVEDGAGLSRLVPGGPGPGLTDLFLTGSHSALSWLPFVIAGMAVARLDLAYTAIRVRLAVTGAITAVIGYGASWLLRQTVPEIASAGSPGLADHDAFAAPAWPAAVLPPRETTLSVLGNTGVAVLVLVACLAACDRMPYLRRLAYPVIAVGAMSLTAFVLHAVALGLLRINERGTALQALFTFIAVIMMFAVSWSQHFRRGPFESLLTRATALARSVR
ncbi:DUF418 domain-containing protein [Streptomyces sp. T-3]|nr:DUF418 domain-containing protein [Streptomyces sp. T-3]